jgi:hypothetical protein
MAAFQAQPQGPPPPSDANKPAAAPKAGGLAARMAMVAGLGVGLGGPRPRPPAVKGTDETPAAGATGGTGSAVNEIQTVVTPAALPTRARRAPGARLPAELTNWGTTD